MMIRFLDSNVKNKKNSTQVRSNSVIGTTTTVPPVGMPISFNSNYSKHNNKKSQNRKMTTLINGPPSLDIFLQKDNNND